MKNFYNIRARVVAHKFAKGELETIFAARPPWEAKNILLSLAIKMLL